MSRAASLAPAPPASAASRPLGRLRLPRRNSVPEGIRITKVGLWYVLFTVIVAIAATNTGNNALYMVLALMLGVLVASGILSRGNVRSLEVALDPPDDIYANRPFHLHFRLNNRGRLLPRWLLLFSVSRRGRPLLVPYLPRRGVSAGDAELLMPRRGAQRLEWVHVSSLFPFGFFRKGVRYRVDLPLLVFPEIFAAATRELEGSGDGGTELSSQRRGRGYDLHALRSFRPGDDPRGIHWKQTARTGGMIFMEREAETGRRLSILFDNGVGELADEAARQRFERLVSEAATAAVDYLGHEYEVELVTRERSLGFGRGARQRRAILETLALVEPAPRRPEPLASGDPTAPRLRLGMEAPVAAGASPEAAA